MTSTVKQNADNALQTEKIALQGSVLASDAFFPFPDGLEEAAGAGATAFVQPGGSLKDEEVIEVLGETALYVVDQRELGVALRVGIASFPGDELTLDALIERARLAAQAQRQQSAAPSAEELGDAREVRRVLQARVVHA